MEIALSSFSPQIDRSAEVESARQRQQQDDQRQAAVSRERAEENQRNRSRAEANQRTPDTQQTERSRVINGEVLSSETERVNNAESQLVLSRSSTNQQPSGEADNRRITSQQAIQNFQENEELVPADNEQRQISGIIDVFV